jgi:hypothetical protein
VNVGGHRNGRANAGTDDGDAFGDAPLTGGFGIADTAGPVPGALADPQPTANPAATNAMPIALTPI